MSAHELIFLLRACSPPEREPRSYRGHLPFRYIMTRALEDEPVVDPPNAEDEREAYCEADYGQEDPVAGHLDRYQ